MKKIQKLLCVVLALAMLLPTMAAVGLAAETENVLFSYDFSDLTAGQDVPSTTTKAEVFSGKHANATALIKAYDDGGNICVEYANAGEARANPRLIKRTNFSRLTNLTVSYRAKGASKSKIELYSGTTNTVLAEVALSDSWTEIEVRFDMEKGTYKLYLNGSANSEGSIPTFENPGLVEVRFGIGLNPGDAAYLDDFVFSTTDTVTPADVFLNTTNVSAGELPAAPSVDKITTVPQAISVPNGMNIILKDDMELHPGSLSTEQWSTVMGNGNYVKVATAAGNKFAAFTNTDTAMHGPRLEKKFDVSGLTKVIAELDFYEGSDVLNISFVGSASTRIFNLGDAADAQKAGWNHLKLELDLAEGKSTAFVNGKNVREAAFAGTDGDSKDWAIQFSCGLEQNWATYLDNVVIYTPDSLVEQMFSFDGTLNIASVKPINGTGMTDILRAHPRLLVTDWDVIREKIATDYRCARWYADILSQANGILNAAPIEYKTNVRGNANDSLLALERRFIILAFATAVEESDTYKNRLMQEIRYVRDSWPNWGEDVFLVCAHAIRVHAFAYDWCYDLFTEAERKEVLDILVNDAVSLSVRAFEGRLSSGYVFTKEHNQNMACTASVLQLAIAIADEYPDAAEYLLEKCRESIEYTLVEIGEDGSFSETMEYFTGGVGELYHYSAALDSAVKDGASVPAALDISGTPGLDKAVDFPIYYQGPVAAFNYGDSVSARISTPMIFYAANKYNKPQYAWYLLQLDEEDASLRMRGREAAYALALFDPSNVGAGDFALDKAYSHKEPLGVNGMSFRSSWTDSDVLFAAMQGGDNEAFHQHFSLGTFVLEYAGQRWVNQTGKHAASGTTYNFIQTGSYEDYYHTRTEGNNTLLINPDASGGQKKDAMAVVEKFEFGKNTSFGILDMTSSHDDYVSAKRGMMLTDNRSKLIIQDEVVAKKPSEFYWFAHTNARVVIADDGKSALMEKNGEKMYVRLAAAPESARFSLMAIEPLPTSPNPETQQGEYLPEYTGDKKLTVHVEGIKEMTLSVEFIPIRDGEGIPKNLPAAVPMAQWKADANAAEPLVRTLGDVVALRIDSPAAFADGKRTFVDENNYEVVPFTENGRTLVPVRFISENFGATVGWEESTQTVRVAYQDKNITLQLGSNEMDVNGNKVILDVPAKTYNDRTLIPLRALVEALGKTVFWDDRGIIVISDGAVNYSEETIVGLYKMLSYRILLGDTELKYFNPEIAAYTFEVADENALPQVSLLQVGSPVEATVTQGNPATVTLGDKTYTIHFTQNPFLGSKYVANTITDFSVAASGQMPAPETDPIIPVADVASSIEWGTYQKSGSIDGIINEEIANRWTGNGAQWISYDLGSVQNVHSLALATLKSAERSFTLGVDVSKDGLNWTTVKAEVTTDLSPMPTIIELGDVEARYVRLNAKRVSNGTYSSYTEVRFYKNHADEQLDWASWNDRFGLNVAAGKVGDTLHLSIAAKNTFGDDVDLSQYRITYESKNPEIASVDANGKVTLKAKGVAIILVKAESFGMMTQSTTLVIGVE